MADDPITILPTPLRQTQANALERAKQQVARRSANGLPAVAVPRRLIKPHPVIASWLAAHKEMRERSRKEVDPWTRKNFDPGAFTAMDHRRHRILDALFKGIESNGGRIMQDVGDVLFAEISGTKVGFQIREKQERARRPLTADEEQLRRPEQKPWKQELVPTGRLFFQIKTSAWPVSLPRQWLESGNQTMEGMLSDILALFIAAGPLLAEQRLKQEAAEHERQIAEHSRRENQRQHRCDENRWLEFREMAQDWHELASVRSFVAALRATNADKSAEIDGRSVRQWIEWAEGWLGRTDPVSEGARGVFSRIAQIVDGSEFPDVG